MTHIIELNINSEQLFQDEADYIQSETSDAEDSDKEQIINGENENASICPGKGGGP